MKVLGALILIPSYLGMGLAALLFFVGITGGGGEDAIFSLVFAKAIGFPCLIGLIIGHIMVGVKSGSTTPSKIPSEPRAKTPPKPPPIYTYEDLREYLRAPYMRGEVNENKSQTGYLLLFPLMFAVFVVVMVYLCRFLTQVLY